MIKNERQYRIAKAHAERFDQALARFSAEAVTQDIHPALRDAEREALLSQRNDLYTELAEYETLRSGERTVLRFGSITDLPRGLIQARIATGVTHKELAERLGVPEQQVQRYEATDYATLSLPRLAEIARALGISVREEIFLPNAKVSTKTLNDRLSVLGLDRDFITHRLGGALWTTGGQEADDSMALRMATIVERIFGISPAVLFSSRPLSLGFEPVHAARFKKGVRASKRRTDAYTVYAHYIALLVLEATQGIPARSVPTTPATVRAAILAEHGRLSFATALQFAWSLGVAVIPLMDPGAFHGACWRVDGRNVIVLKQRTRSAARWLFDLLHELFHAGQEPDAEERTVLEAAEDAEERRASEEQHAMQFAGDVVLDGRAHALAEECAAAAKGSVERLKNAVPRVADRHGVDPASLANYLAFRLSIQTPSTNWWPTANTFQSTDGDPTQVARDRLLGHLNYSRLNDVDRNILIQALSNNEV